MSLQVWLPLTKDLRQQGLSNVTVTNNGATFNSAGKLGGCYAPKGLTLTNLGDLKVYPMTVAFWCKTTNTGTPSWEQIVLIDDTSNSQIHGVYVADASRLKYEYYPSVNAYNVNPKEWHHYTFIINNGDSKVYVDGVLNSSSSETVTADTIGRLRIGTSGTIQLNDFRIYDHCLSPMEVKQLSQGLVLHYPLNRNGWGQDNLFKNSSLTDLTSANLSTKIYYQGSYIPEITQDGLKFTWTGSSAREIDLWLDKTLKADTYYTLSFIYRNNMAIGSSFYLRKDGNLVGYWSQPTIPYSEDWSTYKCTFKIINYQSNDATTGTLLTLFYSGYTANKWIELKQNSIKLEEGSIATPWSPAPSDALATTMGLNGIAEYDCSGFYNNGTRTGTFSWTSDTPKYQVSQYFNNPTGTSTLSDKIYISASPNLYSPSAITAGFWFKKEAITRGGLFTTGPATTSTTTLAIHDYDSNVKIISSDNTTLSMGSYDSFIPSTNIWYHYVITFDGINAKIYINGNLKTTKSYSETKTLQNIIDMTLGANSAGGVYRSAKGYYSDFRIYATALSADDVKSLYQNCATIDPDGTIRGQIRS